MRRVLVWVLLALAVIASSSSAQVRIGDVTSRDGEVPVRVVGYGLVVGLDGTGDKSFGNSNGAVHTVKSVTNLLRRFNIEVPGDRLRLRNVAAVLVTAEISPYLRPGGRFEVQVASLGDATSLRGGVLWMTPLVANPDDAPLATAQGAIPIQLEERSGRGGYRGNSNKGASSGRITDGGILEASLPALTLAANPRLVLRSPDLGLAARVAMAINAKYGPGAAKVEDPGSVLLKAPAGGADSLPMFLAAVDTLSVTASDSPRIVIDARSGMIVAGGDARVGPAVVSLHGITVRIGDSTSVPSAGVVSLAKGATVRDVAVGLQALGTPPADVAAVFDGLRAAGAMTATVVIR
ncbi:MAG: flagellar basal body P-ring protein FlgI [Gemmatimonadota bacterium]